MSTRADGRQPDELRPITFERDFTDMTDGSVLVELRPDPGAVHRVGRRGRPPLDAGYEARDGSPPSTRCCPESSTERIRREVKDGRPSGRTQEIQRLIGRSLRAVVDMAALGERQILVDCDVLQADGGTRTASICGGWLALHDACTRLLARGQIGAQPVTEPCAAISVGIVDGIPMLDLPYVEDVRAEVDMNVVMTGSGRFVEVQGTAEGMPFTRGELDTLLDLAQAGITEIVALQGEMVAVPPSPR